MIAEKEKIVEVLQDYLRSYEQEPPEEFIDRYNSVQIFHKFLYQLVDVIADEIFTTEEERKNFKWEILVRSR